MLHTDMNTQFLHARGGDLESDWQSRTAGRRWWEAAAGIRGPAPLLVLYWDCPLPGAPPLVSLRHPNFGGTV